MKKMKYLVSFVLLAALAFMGFQCSSTEITSAKLYIQQKNYDKALEVLQKDVEKNPKSDEGFYLLGYVNGEKGNFKEMVKNYDKSLAISKSFSQNIDESRKYFWATAFNKGVTFYQRGIKSSDPDSANILFDKSITEFQSASMIQPDSADAYKNLAYVYMSKGDNDAAVEPLQKLIDLEKALDGYRFLGEIYYVKGTNLKNEGKEVEAKANFDKAIKILEQGRKLYPENAELLLVLSNSYIGADRISEAMDEFKAGVEKEPENKYYRYNYGVLLLGAEEFEKAEEQFKKAVEIDPDYTNAVYNLAVTYVKWGTAINKAAEEKGEMNEDYKAKYQAALPYLEKVVQSEDADAATWELLGRVYSVLGMTEDANNAFNKADELRK